MTPVERAHIRAVQAANNLDRAIASRQPTWEAAARAELKWASEAVARAALIERRNVYYQEQMARQQWISYPISQVTTTSSGGFFKLCVQVYIRLYVRLSTLVCTIVRWAVSWYELLVDDFGR